MIYSANYGEWDPPRAQPVPVLMFTEATHPLGLTADYPTPGQTQTRLDAKWWKLHPELVTSEITVWIDASMTMLIPDLEERALAELGDDDALFMRHVWRDCIYDEFIESQAIPAKYGEQNMEAQVAHYGREGHPAHWGLVSAGLIVRRDNERVRAFDAAWWDEIVRWSVQDQISLPPLLRTMDLRWHYWPVDPITAGWVAWKGYNA